MTNPGPQEGIAGHAVSRADLGAATAPAARRLAIRPPACLPVPRSTRGTGAITGTPSTAGTSTVTVTAKDGSGAVASVSFIWTVAPAGSSGNGGTGQVAGYQGLCLDVRAANSADGTPVQVYTCNGTNAQQWTVASNSTLQALGKCLDVSGGGTANGTKVQLYTCNGTGAQVWQPQSNGALLNPQSGKCLDDTGFGGSGTQVQIWSCTAGANQAWTLP